MNSTLQTANKTCFSTTSGKGAVREGDKILCLRVYKYLLGLTYLIEPSDDLRAVLKRDMFVKSNPKAFFLVMHYLFTALDPVEFKQRFYWPLDKNTENTFRSKTVQYLNDLNLKYELDLGTVQTFIVVMPGGTKFLIILLKLIRLVMRDLVKKKQKVATLNDIKLIDKSNHFSKQYMTTMSLKSKVWKDSCTNLVKKYMDNAANLENHSVSLKKHYHELINQQSTSIKSNLYSVKINEHEIIQILNNHFVLLEEQTYFYEQYKMILHTFKTTVQQKLNINSTSLVQFDAAQLKNSIVLLTKYNNESVLNSSNEKLIKSKLANLFLPNKATINLINLYEIIHFYASQIKHQFFNHSGLNAKNFQINANVLDQYLNRLNKVCEKLTILKHAINKYNDGYHHGPLDKSKGYTDSPTPNMLKVSVMKTPRLKWTNLNDVSIAQSHTIKPQSDSICSSNNNTILLSALLSSKKINRSASKRTRFTDLTGNLNLDSSFELQRSMMDDNTTASPSTSSQNFSKLAKNIKINLNTNKFESPMATLKTPVCLSKDPIYKSILKNRNQPNLVSEHKAEVSVSPTGKYDSFIKHESDEDVEDTVLFKRSCYSMIEETIKNRPGSSSSVIVCPGYSSTNSSSELQRTQIMRGGNVSNESGLDMLQTSDSLVTPSKHHDKSTKIFSKPSVKCPYTIIDTIDLTTSVERGKSSKGMAATDENNRNLTNLLSSMAEDNNLLDTSDTCLNDFTLLN